MGEKFDVKKIRFIAKSLAGIWVFGFYWNEIPFVCFKSKYDKDRHFIRYQRDYDWNLYTQEDIEIDPDTLFVTGENVSVKVSGKIMACGILKHDYRISCDTIEDLITFLNDNPDSEIIRN